MTVFLTGASGFIGGHVLTRLLARGRDEVRCLVRPGSDRRNFARAERDGRPVELVEGDLREPEGLRRGLRGCRLVLHCAADYRLWSRDPRELYGSNVEGTRNVLRAAADEGVERVVYTSSVGALGLEPDGRPATEETPVALADMVGHYKRSKYLAERVVDEWVARGLPVVVVNPSAPVGERDLKPTATGRIVLDFLRRRVPAFVDTALNLVDVRDVAEGHLLAAERGQVGRRYILGHRNMSLEEIYGTLADLTGLPAPPWRVPHWLPLAYAAVATACGSVLGREPAVPLEAVRLARHRMVFDPSRAIAELGLPQTPVEEALDRAVAWFRQDRLREVGPGLG